MGAVTSLGPVLQEGARGQPVVDLQDSLHTAGFDPGRSDGVFGPNTKAALVSFQLFSNLPQSGAFDAPTRVKLFKVVQQKVDVGIDEAKASAAKNAVLTVEQQGTKPAVIPGSGEPFYKKKWFVATAGVVGLVLIASTLSGVGAFSDLEDTGGLDPVEPEDPDDPDTEDELPEKGRVRIEGGEAPHAKRKRAKRRKVA